MLLLGIESSCDETAIAVVKDGRDVVASNVYSQIEVHSVFGGVVPEVAAREHLKVIDSMTKQTLQESKTTIDRIDAIAVTQGPGLIGALLVGISYAKGLSQSSGKPLIPVNHVHAHVHGALLGLGSDHDVIFPCISAVVSGGHTNLYYMKSPTSFELLAYSIDDACGESFDKVAKLLNLGYPGGPKIEKLAKSGNPKSYPMPVMVEQKTRLQFSYSGLKTYMVNLINRENAPFSGDRLADLCASFQEEALGQLIRKMKAALELKPDTRSILIAGGVAANHRFKELVSNSIKVPAMFPETRFCSDNAAMIAACGYHICQDLRGQNLPLPDPDWDAFSRYKYI
ncbi:MAG: tRNA (adenosine(37)-N6)-threonylcarbamoyltransferase complex transferase subunit TsaD [Oligoflexales bacterium]|nr:tRNA (adenosine(37)-N6)-threonylcarbamoyltransferase complex transferase subunit TsaD [Oligoflexales bacterium]